jgi:hypothetical protein
MPRSALAFILFLIGLTAWTPPGLCPCWLIAEIERYHPHPAGDPERQHAHDYLFEIFQAENPAIAALSFLPAQAFLLLLALGSLWRRVGSQRLLNVSWEPSPSTPPPRLQVSFR